MRMIVSASLFVAASCLASGQSSAPASTSTTPAFEVASIKTAAPPTDGRFMITMHGDAGRINYTNVSIRDLLRAAYKVKDHQIEGPEWLGSTRFDVVARLPEGAPRDEIPAMLQTLLADRFKLTLHKVPRVMPAYALVPAKGGPKLKPTEGGEGRLRMMMGPRGRHMSGSTTMQGLADSLSNWMDRPVLDMTEIKGTFEVDLQWSGDDGPRNMRNLGLPGGLGGPEGGGPRPDPGAPRPEPRAPGPDDPTRQQIHDENADAPPIFTALQQTLGLRLDSRKAPVDILVIDHIEKVPTEN